jgi:hypothetical protein
MSVKFRLVPRKIRPDSKYVDMVEIQSRDGNQDNLNYPAALIHIDVFWLGRNAEGEIYNLLNCNQEVIVRLEIEEEQNE